MCEGVCGHDRGAEPPITCFGDAKGKAQSDCIYMCEQEIFLFLALYSVTSPLPRSMTSQESQSEDPCHLSHNSPSPANALSTEPIFWHWPSPQKEHIGSKCTSNPAQAGSLVENRPSPESRDLRGPVLSVLFQKGERQRADCFSGMSFQETGKRRMFPRCLEEGIWAHGFAAVDTRASQQFLLEICGSLYTHWVCSVVKEYCGHPSLPSQSQPPKIVQTKL